MTDIAEFIRARLDDEERDARAAYRPGGNGPWTVDVSPSGRATVWQRRPEREAGSSLPPEVHLAPVIGTATPIAGTAIIDNAREVCEHIARQDPAATLARVKALRELVEFCTADTLQPGGEAWTADIALGLVAAIWDDDPAYDESWRP